MRGQKRLAGRGAAELYVRITEEKITPEEVLELINDPDIEFTMTRRT